MNPFDGKAVILNALKIDNRMANFRAKKAGMNLAEQKKLDEKYDAEEERGTPGRLMDWMHEVLGREHCRCVNSTWRKLQFWMRDGVVLCKLVNKLREGVGMYAVKYQGNAHVPVVAQNNVEAFMKGALEYGLDSSVVFQGSDLHDAHKSNFYNVIVCLDHLARLANSRSFTPAYQE